MHRVELIYDADCPNAAQARQSIAAALGMLRLPLEWTEWDRADPAAPAHVVAYGSPTVLVDRSDVGGRQPGETANCCRLYGMDSNRGAPSVLEIADMFGGGAGRNLKASRLTGELPAGSKRRKP